MSAGRIQYNSVNVDFDNPFNKFDIQKRSIQTVNKSLSGLSKTTSYYDSDLISISRNWLTGSEIEQLESWWKYVKDGSTFKIWKDRDIILYAPFEQNIYNVANNVSGVFSRTGNASYLDRSTGLWTLKTDAQPRFPSGKFGDCLVIENASTNYVIDPDDMSTANWTKTNLSVTALQMIAPNGELEADKITASGSGASLSQDTGETISVSPGSFGVWLKCTTGTFNCNLTIEPDTGGTTYVSGTFAVTTEWQYCAVSWANGGSVAVDFLVRITVPNGKTVYAWRPNLELNYWPTSGNLSSRSNELFYFTLPDYFNSSSFSMSFWVKSPWPETVARMRRWINFCYDTSSHFYFRIDSTNEIGLVWTNYDGTDSIYLVATSPYGMTISTWHNLTFVLDSPNADYRIYLNGEALTVNSDDPVMPKIINRCYIGSAVNATEYSDSYFDDIFITHEILNAQQIRNIYRSNRALGIRRNYYSSVRLLNAQHFPVSRVGTDRWDFEAELEEIPT